MILHLLVFQSLVVVEKRVEEETVVDLEVLEDLVDVVVSEEMGEVEKCK